METNSLTIRSTGVVKQKWLLSYDNFQLRARIVHGKFASPLRRILGQQRVETWKKYRKQEVLGMRYKIIVTHAIVPGTALRKQVW